VVRARIFVPYDSGRGTSIVGIALAATILWLGIASAASNRLRGTDLRAWDSDRRYAALHESDLGPPSSTSSPGPPIS